MAETSRLGGGNQASGFGFTRGNFSGANILGSAIDATVDGSSAANSGAGELNSVLPTSLNGGNIVIRGAGGESAPGTKGSGIRVETSAIVTGGDGSVTLRGTGAPVTNYSYGLSEGIYLGGAVIKAKSGNIILEGLKGTNNPYGITVKQAQLRGNSPGEYTTVNPFIGTNGAISISGDSLVFDGGNLGIFSGQASQITAPVISITYRLSTYGLTKTGPGELTFSGDASALTAPGANKVVSTTGIFSDAGHTTVFSGVTRAQALYAFGVPAQTAAYLRLDNDLSSVYGNTPVFTYSLYNASSGGTAITDALPSGTALWTGAPTATSGRGTYNLTYSSGITLGSSSYLLNAGVSVPYTISARPITLTIDPKTKVAGNADPALTYSLPAGSFVGDDSLSWTLSRATGETPGAYAISAHLIDNELAYYYQIAAPDSTLTITQAALPIIEAPVALVTPNTEVKSTLNSVYIVPPIVSRPASAQLNIGLQLVDVAPAAKADSNQSSAAGALGFDPVAAAKRAPGTVLVLTGGVKRASDDKEEGSEKKASSKR